MRLGPRGAFARGGMSPRAEPRASPRNPRPRWRRWVRRTLWAGLGCVVFLVLYAVVFLATGAIPVNRDHVEPAEGVPIWVFASDVHTDLIVPVRHAVHDWSDEFPVEDFTTVGACFTTHIVFGWGDRGFYLEAGEWNELRLSTALVALSYCGRSAMHVAYMTLPATTDRQRRVVLTPAQYQDLVHYIRASFARDAQGRARRIPAYSYTESDAFYEGVGRYGLFYSCNTWTNGALRQAGVRTSLWAVFPHSIHQHLPPP